MSQPVIVPLFAPISTRAVDITQDSHLINGFVEKEGENLWVYKRPALILTSTVAVGQLGLGVFNWKDHIYSVFGTGFYKDGTFIGNVDASSRYAFTSCLGATPQLFLKNQAHAYVYDDSGGLVEVTDGDYPSNTVVGCAYLDGTTYVCTPDAQIDGSDFNDQTSWTPDNVILAQIEPDAARCLAKQLVYVICVKTISTEVFYDAGNAAGSPLGPVQGSKIGVGTRSGYSVVHAGDDLVWLGTTTEGSIQVTYMTKVHAEPISTPPVERLLQNLDYSTVYAWATKVSGHRYYVLTIKNNNITLAFDLSSGSWYIWTDTAGNYVPIVSSTYGANTKPVLQGEADGCLYTFDATTFADTAGTFPFTLVTPNFDGGLRTEKSCASVDILADESDATIDVSWSDDDYQTYVSSVNSLGIVLNQERPMFQDGSSFRKRNYKITNQDAEFLRLKALQLMAAAGSF